MSHDRSILDRHRPVAPPPELKGRVLRAARRAAVEQRSPFSQKPHARQRRGLGWGVAWAAAMLLLLLINVGLDRDLGTPALRSAPPEGGSPHTADAVVQALPDDYELMEGAGTFSRFAAVRGTTLVEQRDRIWSMLREDV